MSGVVPFVYGEQPVRVVEIDGEPWFVLADLCAVLAINNPSMVAQRLDGMNLSQAEVENSRGQMRQTAIVSEAGMYEVVIRSDKPEAVAFRRWITSEVLPTIRKHGAYLTPQTIEQVLTDPDTIIRLATDLKEERALRMLAQAERQLAEQRAAELEPSAAAWDVLASATVGDYSVGDAAKCLSRDPSIETGQNRLFGFMAEIGWIYRHEGRRPGWRAYQAQIETGRLVEKVSAAFQNAKTGELEVPCPTVRITIKGLAELHRRLGGTDPLSPMGAVA